MNDVIVSESVSLNSFLVYNWADKCTKAGYVIKIDIQFCKPFQGLLWFFLINSNVIWKMYSVIPSNTSLYQSFSIPDREMLMYSNYYLAVGTYGSNNTICLRQSGYTYSSEIHNKSVYDQIDAQWQGSTTGVALSYTTFSNGKYRDH